MLISTHTKNLIRLNEFPGKIVVELTHRDQMGIEPDGNVNPIILQNFHGKEGVFWTDNDLLPYQEMDSFEYGVYGKLYDLSFSSDTYNRRNYLVKYWSINLNTVDTLKIVVTNEQKGTAIKVGKTLISGYSEK